LFVAAGSFVGAVLLASFWGVLGVGVTLPFMLDPVSDHSSAVSKAVAASLFLFHYAIWPFVLLTWTVRWRLLNRQLFWVVGLGAALRLASATSWLLGDGPIREAAATFAAVNATFTIPGRYGPALLNLLCAACAVVAMLLAGRSNKRILQTATR
jgi:hypothetical protein